MSQNSKIKFSGTETTESYSWKYGITCSKAAFLGCWMAHHDRSCPACQDTVKWTASPHGPARPARSYPPVSSSMASWASSEILNKNGGFIRKINHKEIAGFSSKPGFFLGIWRLSIVEGNHNLYPSGHICPICQGRAETSGLLAARGQNSQSSTAGWNNQEAGDLDGYLRGTLMVVPCGSYGSSNTNGLGLLPMGWK